MQKISYDIVSFLEYALERLKRNGNSVKVVTTLLEDELIMMEEINIDES